ncbi:MAG: serine/threonine protein kinase [Planctomycetes bacterium]|nr:serine/threonine protein kinase [Planctomycetota bacterium]
MPLTPEQKRRLYDLFAAAMELPVAEREPFCLGQCGSDTALLGHLRALIASAPRADDPFLAGPVLSTPLQQNATLALVAERAGDESGERPGVVIDRYELLEVIGEGGFGTVWSAAQREPVHREVALKVIKLGMDTRQVISRFEVERQALALMDHPNIAKVLDGGVTPSGRPYFVMELVKGVPLTDYCAQQGLGVTARLELFQQVCHAVQHAHQKGVIHRDLKPSNILVTRHGDVAMPKVIDFGVAKATSAEVTQRTAFTEHAQVIGTPEYMAPEQAELSTLDIDTRADVYSLGVLLYELLTGTRPFEATEIRRQGYLELLRVIREEDPPKPSTRIGSFGTSQTDVVASHRMTPRALGKRIRGDLDWIVMKALAKDRARRYATASDLAIDIGRHLQHKPVDAGPPSAGYRLRKYVRRHRIGVFAGGAVACALVTGLAAATWGYFEADAQRQRAEKAEGVAVVERDAARAAQAKAEDEERKAKAEASRTAAVINLVMEMLGSADPDKIKGRDYTVRQLLDDFTQGVTGRLESTPGVEASLRQVMGNAYLGLGLLDDAEACFQRAVDCSRRAYGAENDWVVACLTGLGQALGEQGKYQEAETTFREALAMARKLHGEEHPDVAGLLGDLGLDVQKLGRLDEAEQLTTQALEAKRRLLGEGHGRVALSIDNLSGIYRDKGQLDKAVELSREALTLRRAELGDRHPQTQLSLNNLGCLLIEAGEFEEAETLLTEVLTIRRESLGEESPFVATSYANLAWCLQRRGRDDDAKGMFRTALAIWRKLPDDPHLAAGLEGLAAILGKQGEREEALKLYREVTAIKRKMFGDDSSLTAFSIAALGNKLYEFGDFAGAEEQHRIALDMAKRLFADEPHYQATALHNLACAVAEQGRWAEGERLHEQALAIRRQECGEMSAEVAGSLGQLAHCVYKQSNFVKAEAVLREAAKVDAKVYGEDHPEVAVSLRCLANALTEQRRFDEAAPLYTQVLAMLRKHVDKDDPRIAEALGGQAYCLTKRGDHAGAEAAYRQILEMKLVYLGKVHYQTTMALDGLAACLSAQGRHGEAAETELRCAELSKDLPGGPRAKVAVANGLSLAGDYFTRADRLVDAENTYRKALQLSRAACGERSRETALDLAGLGRVLAKQGRNAEAEPLLIESLEILRARGGEETSTAAILLDLGQALVAQDRYAAAEPVWREAAELFRGRGDRERAANNFGNLAYALYAQRKFGEAAAAQRQALQFSREALGEDDPRVLFCTSQLGSYLTLAGDLDGAEVANRAAVALSQKLHGEHSSEFVSALGSLATVFVRKGKASEAEPLLRQALAVLVEQQGQDSEEVALRQSDLAYVLLDKREYAEARALAEKSLVTVRKVNGNVHMRVYNLLGTLADIYRGLGARAELVAALRERLVLVVALAPPGHPEIDGVRAQLGAALLDDQPAEAESLLRECLAVRVQQAPDSWLRYNCASMLGGALVRQGKYAEAEPLLLEGYEKMQPPPELVSRKSNALLRVIELYDAWGKTAEAAKWRARSASAPSPGLGAQSAEAAAGKSEKEAVKK